MSKLVLNDDLDHVRRITELINKNDGYCPCQIEKTDNTKCPCIDFYNGYCHCKLFISKE